LTFYSILSIVPVMAIAFGIAKGFGFEKMLETQLMDKLPGQQEVIAQIIEFANTMLQNTKGGLIAGIGVAILFWTVVKVLGMVEKSFNDIWGIPQDRSWGRKFSDYLALILICPLLFIASSSLTVAITSQATRILENLAFLGPLKSVIISLLNILSYCVIWSMLSVLYIVMPNTQVKIKSGIVAGIIAGTIYQIIQWIYITFQIGVGKFNAIYGSFAALPLFLVWLQLSWRIVFLGAEISFAYQNVDTYEREPDSLNISHHLKTLFSLRIINLAVKNFAAQKPPLTSDNIAHTLDIPMRLTNQILFELGQARLLTSTDTINQDKTLAYQPAFDINRMDLANVLSALERNGTTEIHAAGSPELNELSQTLNEIRDLIKEHPKNKLLKDI
jgi:membrane protein